MDMESPTPTLCTSPSSLATSIISTKGVRTPPPPSSSPSPRPVSMSSSAACPSATSSRPGSATGSATTTSTTNTTTSKTTNITSRLSIRHGISSESLALLTANPPERKLTSLSYNPNAPDECGYATIVDASTGVQVKRHSDLWFDDGSVICRAEDTLFCVHMSQLARHSLVFHDMMHLSQPDGGRVDSSMMMVGAGPEGAGGMKGTAKRKVPVVYLYDSAEDVGNLLTALYDGPSFGDNDEDDFRVVSGILRLSTKYLIDSLRAKALAHLSLAWPSDLRTWDAREDEARNLEVEGSPKRFPHPFSVISLAREVNTPSLLSSAFYELSRHSIAQIFEPTEDETLYRHPPPPPLLPYDIQRLVLGKEASQHAITTLIQSMGNGQYNLRSHAAQNILSHSHSHSHSAHFRKQSANGVCVSAAACRKDFTELVDLATQHYLFDRERGCYDPLYVAEELGQLKSAEFSECKACAKSLESWAAREREKIWKMIPFWFRLESGVACGGGGGGDASPR